MNDDNSTKRSYRQHRRRARPPEKPGFVWQDRDTAILQAIWENRFLTRDLLVTLIPPADPPKKLRERNSKTGAVVGTNYDRRLSKLFHHGFVDRLRIVTGGPLIYGLTRKGSVQLGQLRPEIDPGGKANSWDVDWDESNRRAQKTPRGQSNIEHTLGIAAFRIAIQRTSNDNGDAFPFHRWHREGTGLDLKAEWKTKKGPRYLIPDAVFELHDIRGDRRRRYAGFLEVDRSTMDMKRMADKFARYSGLYAAKMHQTFYEFEGSEFRVFTTTKSAERAENLYRLVRGEYVPPGHTKPLRVDIPEPHRHLFHFAPQSIFQTHPTNVLASIWHKGSAADPNQRQAIIAQPLGLIA